MSWLDELGFLNPWRDLSQHANSLPHWQQRGSTIFLTFRLADSLPQALLELWGMEKDAWLAANPPPHSPELAREYHERFTTRIERWLDDLHGSCALRDTELAGEVAGVLRRFDGERYEQHAWVVMPNHVHALFTLAPGHALEDVVKSWKGVSARRINARAGGSDVFWQKDYFDRIIRDAEHFTHCARYIRHNPVKARLKAGVFLLFECEAVKRLLQ